MIKSNFYKLTAFPAKLPTPKFLSLINQMLTAKKQLHEAKTESDKTYLEMKCTSIDKQIDQLVYDLYGLTDEEIKIVEESIA